MSEFTAQSNPGDPSDPETYGAVSVDDEDQLQPIDSLVDTGVADVLDEGYSPPEEWSPAEGFGNTPAEALEGESLDQRIAQEVPEPDPYVQAEQEAQDEEIERDLIVDVGPDGAGASAEEAAVHVIED